MENENELDINSQNDAIDAIDENDDIDVLKEKYQGLSDKHAKLSDINKQLFARAKKGEGFELKDGKWIKPEPKEIPPKKLEKSSELDYGQLAFYNSKSDSVKIERDEDIEFLKKTIDETGKSQDFILNSKWFQSELKEKQEVRATKEAVPSGTPRSAPSSRDKVEYWLNKPFNEVPPEMRQAVLSERIKAEKEGQKFAPNPVVK